MTKQKQRDLTTPGSWAVHVESDMGKAAGRASLEHPMEVSAPSLVSIGLRTLRGLLRTCMQMLGMMESIGLVISAHPTQWSGAPLLCPPPPQAPQGDFLTHPLGTASLYQRGLK